VGFDWIFAHQDSPLGQQIITAINSKRVVDLDNTTTKIFGSVAPKHLKVPTVVKSPLPGLSDLNNNRAVSARYILPENPEENFVSSLKNGLIPPTPVLGPNHKGMHLDNRPPRHFQRSRTLPSQGDKSNKPKLPSQDDKSNEPKLNIGSKKNKKKKKNTQKKETTPLNDPQPANVQPQDSEAAPKNTTTKTPKNLKRAFSFQQVVKEGLEPKKQKLETDPNPIPVQTIVQVTDTSETQPQQLTRKKKRARSKSQSQPKTKKEPKQKKRKLVASPQTPEDASQPAQQNQSSQKQNNKKKQGKGNQSTPVPKRQKRENKK